MWFTEKERLKAELCMNCVEWSNLEKEACRLLTRAYLCPTSSCSCQHSTLFDHLLGVDLDRKPWHRLLHRLLMKAGVYCMITMAPLF